jgi:hypothetical protein
MAIEIHLPRKYSRATLEMLRNNDGPNVVMTPGAVETTIEEFTDKAGQPVTKQSVLDIFNKQVIERTNHIPKYSRDYYFVPMGNFGGWHDNGMHAGLVNMLGNAYLSNEYGFMCMHDYLKLSDFKDREGDITIDDLSNTFSETINKLGTLSKLKITIKKGNRVFSESTHYAIGNGSTPSNLIDYNEVKNRIINSDDFNGVCKKWFARIVDNSRNNPLNYEVRLPDPPPPADGGVKLFKKESYYEAVDLGHGGRLGKNSVAYDAIFGEGDTTAFFDIPKVTRNLKGVGINISTSARLNGSGSYGLTIYHKDSNTILGNISRSGGTGNRVFYFDRPIQLSDRSYDDLVLMLNTKVSGDRGDAMGMIATVNELIFDDNVQVNNIVLNPKVDIGRMNSELAGPVFDTNWNNEILKITYKYIVNNWNFKPSVIRSTFTNSYENNNLFVERVEQWRNGVHIGTSLNPTFSNTVTNPIALKLNSRFSISRNHTLTTMKHDVSNLDIRNGDELRFVYGYFNGVYFPNDTTRDHASRRKTSLKLLDTFNSFKMTLQIDDILNKHELISQ